MGAAIPLGIIIGAVLSGAFALAVNFVAGAQLIGFSVLSALIIGVVFGVVGSGITAVVANVVNKWSTLFLLGIGAVYGALLYLANVYFGFNAGFSLLGLSLITGFGIVSALGVLLAYRVLKPLENLQYLS